MRSRSTVLLSVRSLSDPRRHRAERRRHRGVARILVAREPRNTRETGSRLLDPTTSTSPSLQAMSSTASSQVLLCRSPRTAAGKPWPASAPVSAAISRSATPRRLTQSAGLRRNSWLRSELTIPPNPRPVCQASRYTRAPTCWTRISRKDSVLCPAVRTHFACSMNDGAVLLNTARSPVSTCHDSTAYMFASRQKSPTNNLLGQRISHTVLSEFPDASLRTYPRRASREQGQSRPGIGTCSVEHKALGQLMASRIRRSARSPRLLSMPATSDSTIAVAGTTESNDLDR